MKIQAYLTFNGQCEEAMTFYEKCLDGKIDAMLPHEGTPAASHMPANWGKKILHARLTVGENGTVLMPIQQTFWAFRFGMFTDRYGIPWMINCEKDA